MALHKIEDLYPDYKDRFFDGRSIKGLNVYAGQTDEKIGTVYTLLLDDSGHVRYFVIETGFWIFGKKVLLPVGCCGVDEDNQRVYAVGLTHKDQVEQLPGYDETMVVDHDYEEQVRSVYRMPSVEDSMPVEAPVSAKTPRPQVVPMSTPSETASISSQSYNYDQEPTLYQTNEKNHQNLRLYEERLVADRQRHKTGEVTVSKRVETNTSEISVPVEKETIVIEITSTGGSTKVAADNQKLGTDDVIRMDLHEETADVQKETVVHQEVNIRKEVEQQSVQRQDTVRREELDIKQSGTEEIDI